MTRAVFLLSALSLATLVGICVGAGACATPKSAETHREIAAAEESKAAEHRARYDENASAVALGRSSIDPNVIVAEDYNPTHWEKVAADAHSRTAEQHRLAARALEESEDAACVGTEPAARAACPLLLPSSVEDIPGGVRVTFTEDKVAARAANIVRCQQAFATTRGFTDLPSCALYARKLKVTSAGKTLTLEASDSDGVARLRANLRGHHPSPN